MCVDFGESSFSVMGVPEARFEWSEDGYKCRQQVSSRWVTPTRSSLLKERAEHVSSQEGAASR